LIDDPRNIAETRQYLQDFNRMDDTTTTARELYDAMLGLYSDCTNRRRVTYCSPRNSSTRCAETASRAALSRFASAAVRVSRLPSKSCTEESESFVVCCSCNKGDQAMPLAKIHVVEGRYDETRIAKVSGAIQAALMNTLRVPPEDFYQLIFEFPKKRFLHTPSFVGMHYTDDLIILDLTFIEGRSRETRLALLKDVNTRVVAAAGVSPDDLMITLYEAPGENFSFGRGDAQRANAVPREQKSHAS
jgi:phenylpyruvate tautomerase PptA (4-oxalocrotonate tautomerase family)